MVTSESLSLKEARHRDKQGLLCPLCLGNRSAEIVKKGLVKSFATNESV